MDRVPAWAILLSFSLATRASASDRIAMMCSGQETIQVGTQPPVIGAYSHYVSLDLAAGLVCYDKCSDLETYKIADGRADPIKITDYSSATHSRHILYDRKTWTLTDEAQTVLGPISTKTTAVAKCATATYRQPPSITSAR